MQRLLSIDIGIWGSVYMLEKFLSMCLLVCCVAGCMIEPPDNGDNEEIQSVDILGMQDQTAQQTSQENAGSIEAECLPDFHGELITGEFNSTRSDRRRIAVNQKAIIYYYTLNLLIDDSIYINIVLEEAALAYSAEVGLQIDDEDFLLVKLDRLLEPGIWQGTLVKNLTRNISFE